MKKNIICLLLIAAMAAGLLFNASATDTADLKVTGAAHSGGNITVSVEFVNIPENNPVEYAQILLTCRTSQHNIASGSMRFNGDTNDMLATETFNTSADSLLVLLEPTGSSSVGMGNGLVYTFSLRNTGGQAGPAGFDLAAVLILKDGTEHELNQRINASITPAPTTSTSTSQPTTGTPTEPSTTVPSTPSTPTQSSTPSQPTTGDNNETPPEPQPSNTNSLLLILTIALALFFAGACVILWIHRNKNT